MGPRLVDGQLMITGLYERPMTIFEILKSEGRRSTGFAQGIYKKLSTRQEVGVISIIL